MMRSLQAGVNGVRNHQLMMDVVGNNIANVNTIGFKGGRITFADTISQLIRGGSAPRDNRGGVNPVQVGLGMKIQSVDNNFGQGSLENTGYTTDLAIQGNGFFVVRSAEKTLYTRAGNFTIDANGRLVTGNGVGVVQGRIADSDGRLSNTAIEDILIPLQRKTPPRATDRVTLYSNLDEDATMAIASLVSSGRAEDGTHVGSGVTSVTGTAADGVGGTHSISISGQNAVRSTGFSEVDGLTITTRLEDINGGGANGVTLIDDFQVTVDSGTSAEVTYNITGLSPSSTVGDLIRALEEQVPGVNFELISDPGDPNFGTIQITRDYAGDGTSFNVILSDGSADSDIVTKLFDATGTMSVSDGMASTLIAVDTFTDNAGNPPSSRTLTFEADTTTGLMTRLLGVGRSGIEIIANGGFGSTLDDPDDVTSTDQPIIISTADTTHSTSINVFDELGHSHNMTLKFIKTSVQNEWRWEASVPEPANNISGHYGTVQFNTDGTLRAWNYENNRGAFSFDPGTSNQPVTIVIDPGTFGALDGITQTAAGFTTTAVSQNGYGMGTLESIDIDSNGEIIGNFSNGVDLVLAAIALANFRNNNGLERASDNYWQATEASGDPVVGLAETNFGSTIQRGFLEMSNVDLVKEFTDMITAQRGFQANARVITVADQILTEVTNLKR